MTDEPEDDTPDDATPAGWGLVLPFLTDSVEFCNGVEIGMLYERMKVEDRIGSYFHTANQEQITLMANRSGWTIDRMEVWADGPEWFLLEMHKKGSTV